MVQSLAEMTTYLPVDGASVPFYVHRFFEPSLAFAAGWNYWYSYAMLVAAEVSAASVVIDYWDNPVYVFAAMGNHLVMSLMTALLQTGRGMDHHHTDHCSPSQYLCSPDLRRGGILVCFHQDHRYFRAYYPRYRALLWWRT